MLYVIIDGSVPDSESGFFMREYKSFDVESMPEAKELALNELSEERNIWIYDDERGYARMPLLSVWHSKQHRWEDTPHNINQFLRVGREHMVIVKIKKTHPEAKIPTKGTKGAACFDLYAVEDTVLKSGAPRKKLRTGVAMEIPEGHCGRIYSRSSSFLKGLDVGSLVADADYRGEIYVMCGFFSDSEKSYTVRKGDRIAQIKIERLIPTSFFEVDELSETARGEGGYGSTGR